MLVGAATIILTIPFTALISALMLSGKEEPQREFVIDGSGEQSAAAEPGNRENS